MGSYVTFRHVHWPNEVERHEVVPGTHVERRKATRSTPEELMRLECQAKPMSVVLLSQVGPCSCPSEPLPEVAVNGAVVEYRGHCVPSVLYCTRGKSHWHWNSLKLIKQD